MAFWLLFCVVPAVPLLMTLLNLALWRRPQPCRVPGGPHEGQVSVLIPARNEGERIEQTLRCALDSPLELLEVVVYDDQSSDDTASVVERIGQRDSRVRLLRGGELPAGWVGKPHACHRLAQEARGDVLLFLDADVQLAPSALGGLTSLLEEPARARVVTAVPQQLHETFLERLVLPLLVITYTSWLPLSLVERGRNPSTVAANGQLLLLRRGDYETLGGFASVRAEIVDDVAFCRHAKSSGYRVVFADGSRLATCRMYRSGAEVWRGFSKNVFEGLGGSLVALVIALSLYLCCWVVPYLGLMIGLWARPEWVLPSLGGVLSSMLLRVALVLRFKQPLEGIALHPVAVLVLCAIAINSLVWHRRGQIRWADRSYARRSERLAPLPPGLGEGELTRAESRP